MREPRIRLERCIATPFSTDSLVSANGKAVSTHSYPVHASAA